MRTECNRESLVFQPLGGREVVGRFDECSASVGNGVWVRSHKRAFVVLLALSFGRHGGILRPGDV